LGNLGDHDFNNIIIKVQCVYRRHTNFASESIEQTFTGSPTFGARANVQLTRNADVVTKMYLRATLGAGEAANSAQWGWVSNVGHAIIDNYYLEIGGTQIDKQYGDWLNIWYELTHKVGQERGYSRMVGNVASNTNLAVSHDEYVVNVPLQFFNCRHDGLGIPLIALQYHEVRIYFEFVQLQYLTVSQYGSGSALSWTTKPTLDASLWVDYIYLDQEERKRFAQATHEYLIEQVQFPSTESVNTVNTRTRLSFNHPCKFLAWVVRLGRYTSGNRFLAYSATDANAMLLEATKRFILGWALLGSGGAITTNGDFVSPVTGLNAEYTGYFRAAGAIVVDVNVFSTDNVTITGALLPIEVASQSADVFETNSASTGSAVRNTNTWTNASGVVVNNEGAVQNDIVVYMYDNYGLQLDRSENPVQLGLLQLNGHDRFDQRDGDYFNYVQPYQCFSNTPSDGVNVYSFALTPEEHQPSGTCNFSRIDNATLALTLGRANESATTFKNLYLNTDCDLNIYAFNYNVLRVMSGMAGLAYSN
jgi:hypothetical protein